ncbi:MAG: hypothetical protein U5Q44_11365 [Dehalococcoidia bacterium]|nr:hypothetical protein [Dehalococcoidia bacterium]
MSTVETVLGPVEGGQLGSVLSHEHVLVAMGNDVRHYPWRFDMQRTLQNAVRELSEAREGGIDTIIDLTTPDLGRDVRYIREAAQRSGMQVVVATGLWRDIPRSFWNRDPDDSMRRSSSTRSPRASRTPASRPAPSRWRMTPRA